MNRSLCSALVVVTGALAACGSTSTPPSWFVRTYLGAPSSISLTDGSPVAVWAAAHQMAVVVWWSSSCPKLPIALKATGDTVTLTLSSGTGPNGEPCTTDLAPTTTVVRVPDSVDQRQVVSVVFVNDGSARHTFELPPRTTGGLTPTPPSTPQLADCGSEIQLVGASNDCAAIDRTAVDDCTVTPHTLHAVFKLDGTRHDWYLSLSIPRTYPEPGDYYLANGGAQVDVTNAATGAVWSSVSGDLTTATPDSRSGTVTAILQAAEINQTPAPGPTLSVNGSWRC